MDKITKNDINMYELLVCLTNAGDLVSPRLADHHQKVAYLAYRIGEQCNLSQENQKKLMLSGLLHDVGALSYDERLELIDSEPPSAQDHAFKGAYLLEGFAPLSDIAKIIKYHHVPWDNGKGEFFNNCPVSILSHIIHLADRIAVMINPNKEIIGQISHIRNKISKEKGSIFSPELVEAFLELSVNEYIWLDVVYKPLLYILPSIIVFDTVPLDADSIIELVKVFAKIIDFRSPYTSNHSAGVAKVAEKLADYAGFSQSERKMMLTAGYLHDFGKLAVRNEVLEKPSKLTREEFNIVKTHTFYTYRLLQSIKGFETINEWASLHHEKIDGTGYPFHLDGKSLSLGSRIVAVADVFTAIIEDRPYRKGMTKKRVASLLTSMVENQSLCPYVVSLLIDNLDTLDTIRQNAQEAASREYISFQKTIG